MLGLLRALWRKLLLVRPAAWLRHLGLIPLNRYRHGDHQRRHPCLSARCALVTLPRRDEITGTERGKKKKGMTVDVTF